jgi:hypothetical protein
MHRVQSKLAAWQDAKAEANKLGKRNEDVIAETVVGVVKKATRMDATMGWDLLSEILEQACREAANPAIRNSPKQRGLFKAIPELQEILPNVADTKFVAGDLAAVVPIALKSPA